MLSKDFVSLSKNNTLFLIWSSKNKKKRNCYLVMFHHSVNNKQKKFEKFYEYITPINV